MNFSAIRFLTLSTIALILLLTLPGTLSAQDQPNENRTYDPSIRTVQLFREGFEMAPPVITLNGKERLLIRFDDLGEDSRRFRFTIRHCDAAWRTSADISVSDYIEGYREENIDDYKMSYNTTIPYYHYQTYFPTTGMRPKISGNYLLIVYDDEPANVVFTARFMVTEEAPLIVRGTVSSARTDLNRQQVDFTVLLNGMTISNVEREVRVVIMQNDRLDNAVMVSKPRFARGDELDYRYDEAISFAGGNQFRFIDIRNFKYQAENVARISFDTAWQVNLRADVPRSYKQYVNERDFDGRFYISNDDHAENSDIEADYGWVHLFVPIPTLFTDATVHVLGGLTDWRLDESSRLYFNPEHQGYEIRLLLKQGYYNYQYAVLKKGATMADVTMIEGNHWETENEYNIMIYFRETGSLFDRLLNFTTLNSKNR